MLALESQFLSGICQSVAPESLYSKYCLLHTSLLEKTLYSVDNLLRYLHKAIFSNWQFDCFIYHYSIVYM